VAFSNREQLTTFRQVFLQSSKSFACLGDSSWVGGIVVDKTTREIIAGKYMRVNVELIGPHDFYAEAD